MKKHNFSAGPSILPEEVLEKSAKAVLSFDDGLSLIEISHRSKAFIDVMENARALAIELLGLVSSTRCHASTPSLSTWWSSTTLKRDIILRLVSRLDAFSGYPLPYIATRLRGWRHDRSTRGTSIPVLSY